MNVFYIPSWYPSVNQPIRGIFFRETAISLGKADLKNRIIISLWGEGAYSLPLANPIKAARNLKSFLKSKKNIKKISENVWEITRPVLLPSKALVGDRFGTIYKVTESNFVEALKRFGPIDIIHAQVSYPAGFLAKKLAQKFNLPYLITEHSFLNFPENKQVASEVKQALDGASRIVAISAILQKRIEKAGFKNIEIIPNLVDEDFFKPRKSKNRKFTFFTLGHITPQKGIGDLISAIPLVLKKNPQVIFRIGGSGKFLKKYQKRSDKIGIGKNIVYLGPLNRQKVRNEFQNADAFILPSHYETFGMVYIEAMACGKPVIATRCGGPKSIVTNKTGILVKVGDIGGISKAILKMAKNVDSYKNVEIRKEFMAKFSRKAVAKEILKVYREVILNGQKS